MELRTKRTKPQRRTWVAGLGVTGLAAVGTGLYRAAPSFWQQYATEMKQTILPAPSRPQWEQWSDTGVHAAWLGHSTVLLKIDGFTMLTDPVFSERCGIGIGPLTLGLKRLVAPALGIADIPKIDLVILSHAHMDHFDIPSLRKLEGPETTVITARRTTDLLRPRRYKKVLELAWGESAQVGPVRVQAFEVNHWGARVRTDVYRGYNGYLIEAGGRKILFGGDTAMTGSFAALKTSKAIDLAIMPIGAYNPWIRYHCNPEQAVQMGDAAGAEIFLPVHHQTFHLSAEPVLEPIERFIKKAGESRVIVHKIGDSVSLA